MDPHTINQALSESHRRTPAGSQTQKGHLQDFQLPLVLVSSHGSVLFYIAANPDCMISDITDGCR
jgi:hypothetical protein